jgi:amino-acid N-acetyltransferase
MTQTTHNAAATIRSASATDFQAVSRLLSDSSLPLDGVPESLDGFLVAEADGAVVGVAGLESCCDNALLRSVAVRPEWRSRGLGRTLVERIIAEAEGRGIHGLYLLTTTAEHYFPSFGFRKVARTEVPREVQLTQEFRGACPSSATAMALQLRGTKPA